MSIRLVFDAALPHPTASQVVHLLEWLARGGRRSSLFGGMVRGALRPPRDAALPRPRGPVQAHEPSVSERCSPTTIAAAVREHAAEHVSEARRGSAWTTTSTRSSRSSTSSRTTRSAIASPSGAQPLLQGRGRDEDPAAFDRLPRDAVLVYLMNHRSNADYVLVSYALAGQVAISYAVGEWARAFPLEYLFKAFGSYFVRRRYREPLYHTVLERYVQLITREGVTQGIFLEGGLTRDGRLSRRRSACSTTCSALRATRRIARGCTWCRSPSTTTACSRTGRCSASCVERRAGAHVEAHAVRRGDALPLVERRRACRRVGGSAMAARPSSSALRCRSPAGSTRTPISSTAAPERLARVQQFCDAVCRGSGRSFR